MSDYDPHEGLVTEAETTELIKALESAPDLRRMVRLIVVQRDWLAEELKKLKASVNELLQAASVCEQVKVEAAMDDKCECCGLVRVVGEFEGRSPQGGLVSHAEAAKVIHDLQIEIQWLKLMLSRPQPGQPARKPTPPPPPPKK